MPSRTSRILLTINCSVIASFAHSLASHLTDENSLRRRLLPIRMAAHLAHANLLARRLSRSFTEMLVRNTYMGCHKRRNTVYDDIYVMAYKVKRREADYMSGM